MAGEPDEEAGEPDEEAGGLPEVVEQIGNVATGLPPQLQRNLWKAVGRILTGLAEWPAAGFEGLATKRRARDDAEAADIRAEQRAREIVRFARARAAARQFGEDPELGRRAAEYHAADIVREQANREAVLKVAVEDLTRSPAKQDATTDIDGDWLTAFLKEASSKSSEEVRALFGRILAGEIRSPGSFSIRTLLHLSFLNQGIARRFEMFCNISIALKHDDVKLISDPFGDPNRNALKDFGLSYRELSEPAECDLVRAGYNDKWHLPETIYKNHVPFDYSGITVWLAPVQDADVQKLPAPLTVHAATLTAVGAELRRMVAMQPVPEYTDRLKEWFRSRQLVMYRAVRREGDRLYGEPL